MLTDNALLDKEVQTRIKSAKAAFSKLYQRVWTRNKLDLKTNVTVYRTMIVPILTHDCETLHLSHRCIAQYPLCALHCNLLSISSLCQHLHIAAAELNMVDQQLIAHEKKNGRLPIQISLNYMQKRVARLFPLHRIVWLVETNFFELYATKSGKTLSITQNCLTCWKSLLHTDIF